MELPVEELLRRVRPLPDHDEMVIEDLNEEEGEAFLAAVGIPLVSNDTIFKAVPGLTLESFA